MNTRSTRSTVKFFHPFSLRGQSEVLPAGDYEILVEEELLQDMNFLGYRKTATYLMVSGKGRTHMREISGNDLEAILDRDRSANDEVPEDDADVSPQEDLK
ncbi:hypothetical protein [Roseibium sediminicola]|uniref:Uncharacterized protein n=1 Tax=Roseibium sediminicola TaxID=2933272 RepID=A0ABT0GQK8_9HYPH|nr:hypothetical protein [Roseibium sp. CAU 1639]MCK7611721.1 hypothetical protein [Roseibium sp. CAU 1639]